MVKLFPSIFLSLLLPLAVAAQSVQIQDGAILAAFSVSDSTKVYFSQGNMQYQASTNTWRFAEHQWDMMGTFEGNIIEKSGFVDLFNWGTISETSKGFSYKINTIDSINYKLKNCKLNFDDYIGKLYNICVISDIKWRMLTMTEWTYILTLRRNADTKVGIACIDGFIPGLVLLPDNWELPDGLTFRCGFANYSDMESPSYFTYRKYNNYSSDEWSKMENNGAIFLPCSGGIDNEDWDDNGNYWVYTKSSLNEFVYLYISEITAGFDITSNAKMSVRLVQDVK